MPVSSSIYQFLNPGAVAQPEGLGSFRQGYTIGSDLEQQRQNSLLGQMRLAELQRQQQVEDQFRARLRQEYATGGTPGMAGLAPAGVPGAVPPVQEVVNTPYGPDLQAMLSQYQQEGAPVTPTPGARTLPASPMGPAGATDAAGTPAAGGVPAAPGMGMPASRPSSTLMRDLGMIDPLAARKYEKEEIDREKSRFELLERQNDLVASTARSILQDDTQAGYERGVAYLRSVGIPVDHLPRYYDRKMVKQYAAWSTDTKTQLERQKHALNVLQEQRLLEAEKRQRQQYDLDVQKYGLQEATQRRQEREATETERHHRATEEQATSTAERTQTQQQAERENQLRDEYNTLSKDYRLQSDAYGRVQVSAQDPSAAGDLSMIFSYMKLLDPGSVVREGEQATAANARGVDEGVRSWYNRVLSGERLAPEQRTDFVDRAQRLYDQATQDNQRIRAQYEERAQRYGVDPRNVTTEFGSTAPRGGKTLTEADITATITDSQQPGNTPVTRAQVLEWGRTHGYTVPGK